MKPATKLPAKSPPKVRARRMWLVRHEGGTFDICQEQAIAQMAVDTCEGENLAASMEPVFVLDASKDSHDARVEVGAKAICEVALRHSGDWGNMSIEQQIARSWDDPAEPYLAQAAALLRAIGLGP